MQSLKFKDKVKKKVKEFLAVTLISSSILVGCGPTDNSFYGNSDYEFTDNDTNEKPDKNDTKPVNDEKQDEEKELDDDVKNDNDIIKIDEEFFDDDNDIINDNDSETDIDVEVPDEPERLCENTGTKYIVDCEALREAYEDECLDFIVVSKLLSENCGHSKDIDLETPAGKCFVPSYMTGNAPVQGTNACMAYLLLNTMKGRVKIGYHESNPENFYEQIKGFTHYLLNSYLAHKYVTEEDIRYVVSYPYDNINEEYLISGYVNSFEYGGMNYNILNENISIHEMEFTNVDYNKKTRLKMYMNILYYLDTFPLIPLDLMKCPSGEEGERSSIAVLGFFENKSVIDNDPKFKRHLNGECDDYYRQKLQEFVKLVLGE